MFAGTPQSSAKPLLADESGTVDPEDRPLTRVPLARVRWENPIVSGICTLPPMLEDKAELFYSREEENMNRVSVTLESGLIKCVGGVTVWVACCYLLLGGVRCMLHGNCTVDSG